MKTPVIGIVRLAAIAGLCALGLILAPGTAALAKDKGNAGGKSESHISEKGSQNTNSPASGDQDKGQERAQERRGDQGVENGKAPDEGDEHGSSKGKGKAKGKGKGKGKGKDKDKDKSKGKGKNKGGAGDE